MKKVKEIMTEEVAFCTPETPLGEVARLMCDHDCGEIPVIDNEESLRPIGVITDRDITCRLVAAQKNPLEYRASDCMSSPCVTVFEEEDVRECCRLLEENQIRRIPVVDEQGCCCGIVAQADLALQDLRKAAGVLHEVSRPE